MPCDSKPLTPTAIENQRAALNRLETGLALGSVQVIIGATGSIAFKGWNDREDLADLCAYRRLSAANSPALRKALARAEAMAGRKVDQRQVAAGVHSHDGGRTFHNGH